MEKPNLAVRATARVADAASVRRSAWQQKQSRAPVKQVVVLQSQVCSQSRHQGGGPSGQGRSG